MMDCKKALQETEGDLEKAVDLLRSRGAAKAAKRGDRSANEGTVGGYIHHNGKVGVMVQLSCETDFVAKTDDFLGLARDLAMHIASAAPLAVSTDDLPEAEVERERQVYLAQVAEEGKAPEKAWPKIIEGKLGKWMKEICLLEQQSVIESDKTVDQIRAEVAKAVGASVEVTGFVRFERGEGIEKPQSEDFADEVAKMAKGE